jgi:hypothetical protein
MSACGLGLKRSRIVSSFEPTVGGFCDGILVMFGVIDGKCKGASR